MALDVLNIVKLGGERVVDVDDDDLPVGFLLVEESHDTKDLDLLHLTNVADKLANLADVEGIIVTLGLGLGVDGVGVFPGLCDPNNALAISWVELRLVSSMRMKDEGRASGGPFLTWGKAP